MQINTQNNAHRGRRNALYTKRVRIEDGLREVRGGGGEEGTTSQVKVYVQLVSK